MKDEDYEIYDNPDLSSGSVAERAAALVRRGGWYQIYGLARREALEKTRGLRDVFGSDVVLMLELALQGPILRVPEVLFWFRQYEAKTEEMRAHRQGNIADVDQVLRAKYTFLQESLSDAVRASELPLGVKASVSLDILRAAYIEDTPLSRHARKELSTRRHIAVADSDYAGFAKYALLEGTVRARRSTKRLGRRAGRLAGRVRP